MKIGIDASRANNNKKTGVEWYAWHIIQGLKIELPKDVQVVLYTNEPLKGELAKLPNNWTQKVLRWPPKRLWTQVRLSWEMLVASPDVLFIPAHVFPIIHPKKTIMTVHDVAALKFPKSYNWFERWYSVFSVKLALKKLWRIIVPSEFTKIEIEKLRNKEIVNNVLVVPHGYDKRYRNIKDIENIKRILKKYYLKKPFIMSIGRLEEKKNTSRILEAFDLLKQEQNYNLQSPTVSAVAHRRRRITNHQLLLVGKPGYGYEKVQKSIAESKFKDDIIQPGWVNEEDLPYLMNAAEAFIFPSLYEGFGLPVLEAMACGTPVLTSTGSSLEEIGGEVALYVNPENVQDIAKGMSSLIFDERLRSKKIELGMERVKKFSWEECVKQTASIIVS